MKSLKKKISITLDEEIIRRIKDLSEETDRSFSQFVNHILRNYFYRRNLIRSPNSSKT
ncbi:MAG: DUF6364 family protein [Candidatus Heritagella sp.]|nr:DUF6364 family protein [Candidatus Heritagella sp.]